MKNIDYTGRKMGRLTAVKFFDKDKYSNNIWTFKCDCGKEINRAAYVVFSGNTHSCGCLKKEEVSKRRTTHGLSGKNRFYKIWGGMIFRCKSKIEDRNYTWYKNIKVCERWERFENFRDDLLKSYEEHIEKFGIDDTTIDRIDTFGDYEPSNVRWATRKEQSNNRKNNKIIPSQA